MEQPTSFTAYYRVSTSKQGESGLGIEAQRQSVRNYIKAVGGELVHEYVEVESGRKSQRPELDKAIKQCTGNGSVLLIAKLDRLARNVHFVSGLLESGAKFIAVDMPNADRFMLHVYAAMAEEEARKISLRTKAALAAAKKRGVVLGKHSFVLAAKHKVEAEAFASNIGPVLFDFVRTKNYSFRIAAEKLNQLNMFSFRGKSWHPTSVYRTLERYEQQIQNSSPLPPQS